MNDGDLVSFLAVCRCKIFSAWVWEATRGLAVLFIWLPRYMSGPQASVYNQPATVHNEI